MKRFLTQNFFYIKFLSGFSLLILKVESVMNLYNFFTYLYIFERGLCKRIINLTLKKLFFLINPDNRGSTIPIKLLSKKISYITSKISNVLSICYFEDLKNTINKYFRIFWIDWFYLQTLLDILSLSWFFSYNIFISI